MSCSSRRGRSWRLRGDHVRLGADDRREVGFARGAVEVEDAVHVPVVGDADRGLAVGRGGGHDLGDARRTVEHRVLGVEVEVDERLGQRRAYLPRHFHSPVHSLWMNHTGVVRTTVSARAPAGRPRAGPRSRLR